ncbi:MAG: MerR family transcriptional regulator, partial [Gordonibacter sp.]
MTDQRYLTVGELARRVGVTVRTIQYYDQQGLLSPSAKGPQNQRLYTDANVKDLYRIMTLKYLGLSLAQIKSDAGLFDESCALQELASRQMDAIEDRFQQLFKRMTTLRAVHDLSVSGDPDWENL